MTGIFYRVRRDGKWVNVELEHLTFEERNEKLRDVDHQYLMTCINMMSRKLQDAEKLLNELVEDGVLQKVER